ncbi:hypothetical protein [Desulfovibrio sp.]|uniref:hypothetical protein n=1 Tax=Desulfovibrio sp. TaxID=885 RepID=UPI0025C4C733|nr:hypothetical protein [Desulfovibrio sp.]MCI7568653.1 hypothetical protein [Desulfovibrio sp.]
MVTPANATRLLCRAMFGVWLLAVCGMGLVALGGGSSTGNLLALMFTRPVARTPLPPPPTPPAAQPEPTPEPAPAPAEPTPPPVVEASQWRDLPHGKRPGRGRIFPPRIEVRKDGSLLLLFAYEGTLGEHTALSPANITSRSVDIHGQWSAQVTVDARPQGGCVQRLQIASHPSWIRISAVSRGGKPLDADVSYSDKELRVIFQPAR